MELTGNLKKQVERAETIEEKKRIIEKAGMRLTEAELDAVAGGVQYPYSPQGREFDAEENMRDPYFPSTIKW